MKWISVMLIAALLALSVCGLAETAAPDAGAFAEGFFGPVAGYEAGTAGCSLKLAAACAGLLRFVRDHRLWEADGSALGEIMLSAWEALDGDARARFDENLPGFTGLIDAAVTDYASVAGQFEDAGAGDMADLAADEQIRQGWEALIGSFYTMGNEG